MELERRSGLALSLLEVVPMLPGVTAPEAIAEATRLARKAEELRFRRVWVGEHHGVRETGSSAPAVLVAHFASQTQRIRVGAGGVMLTNHLPLVVAEQFVTLEALHPDRIDLGVGRSSGAAGATAAALRRSKNAGSEFSQRLDELCALLATAASGGDSLKDVNVSPCHPGPPVFVLGSGVSSALVAAERGLPLAFAHHLDGENTANAITEYRQRFRGTAGVRPYVIITACFVAARSAGAAALELAKYYAIKEHMTKVGGRATHATAMAVASAPATAAQLSAALHVASTGTCLVGTGDQVARGIAALASAADADEVMLIPLTFDYRMRIEGLAAISEAFTTYVQLDIRRSGGRQTGCSSQ